MFSIDYFKPFISYSDHWVHWVSNIEIFASVHCLGKQERTFPSYFKKPGWFTENHLHLIFIALFSQLQKASKSVPHLNGTVELRKKERNLKIIFGPCLIWYENLKNFQNSKKYRPNQVTEKHYIVGFKTNPYIYLSLKLHATQIWCLSFAGLFSTFTWCIFQKDSD